MNNSKIKRAVEQLKNIRMTTEEKSAMFERIIEVPQKPEPVVSPWTLHSFRTWIERHRLVALPAVIVLLLAISGTNVALAAKGSLPGDLLYPVKTNIIEPLEGTLAITPVAKANFNASIVSTRLDEAETLASEGRLDPVKEQQIEASFNTHVSALSDELNVIAKTDASSSDALRTAFQANMNSQADILDAVTHRFDHGADHNAGHNPPDHNADHNPHSAPSSSSISTSTPPSPASLPTSPTPPGGPSSPGGQLPGLNFSDAVRAAGNMIAHGKHSNNSNPSPGLSPQPPGNSGDAIGHTAGHTFHHNGHGM